MIVFHEGLPGAGKSYEACAMHILPAVEKGRRVVTNIEGINHEKFSELTHIPLLDLREQLICVFDHDIEEQKRLFLEYSGKDALIIIDEIQNLFPQERAKLNEDWNRYISEHRHDGLDIVLMGQDRRDCHNMWRRRIQRVITFNKLSAVGSDKRYRWECLEATGREKFKKVTSGIRSYDPKYFGLYKSHTDGTSNTSVYVDKRANVLNNKSLRFAIVGAVVACFFAISFLIDFFTPDEEIATPATRIEHKEAPAPVHKPEYKYVADVPPEPIEPEPIDLFDDYAKKYRVRLAALIYSTSSPENIYAQVDLLDASYHKKETFTLSGLRDMGWSIKYRESGLYITKQGVTHIARPWPIDKFGRVDQNTANQL